uniref:BZIP domain-containing protein n=1 Tax=Steinernema glaseri TaxID=37863 RepID=A0A1I8A1Q2_9BILA
MTPSLARNTLLSEERKEKVCRQTHALLSRKWTREEQEKFVVAKAFQIRQLKKNLAAEEKALEEEIAERKRIDAENEQLEREIARLKAQIAAQQR